MMTVPVPMMEMMIQETAVYSESAFDKNAHGAVVETANCGVNGSNVKYTLYADGTVYFSGKGKMKPCFRRVRHLTREVLLPETQTRIRL